MRKSDLVVFTVIEIECIASQSFSKICFSLNDPHIIFWKSAHDILESDGTRRETS